MNRSHSMNVGLVKCQFKGLRIFFLWKDCAIFFGKLFREMGDTLVVQEDSNLSLGIQIISWAGSTYIISACLRVAFSFASFFIIIPKVFYFVIEKNQIVRKLFSCLCQISHQCQQSLIQQARLDSTIAFKYSFLGEGRLGRRASGFLQNRESGWAFSLKYIL